ncbi:MAG: ubiquinol-cytochrome c reductase iron-sulfur subunit [Betaproteobacteria bacterium]|nr:ubiquinol-cytochrome c reductase iron-sulfur subunit [Betaproteobacteria bacterium]
MSDYKKKDCDGERRNLLLATSAVGGAAVVAAAVPFVASLAPSERAKAAGAPVVVDISKLAPGEKVVVKWRGKPVWVLRRTPEMLQSLEDVAGKLSDPNSEKSDQPDYTKNPSRAIKDEYFVAIGICTHLGCSPTDKLKPGNAENMAPDWTGGFLCPCHGSLFDLAGRVYKSQPAPTNLDIPPHRYLSDTEILIGEDSNDSKGA